MRTNNTRDKQRDGRNGTGSEDGLAKAIEIVVTPAIFAAAGYGLDQWWGTGPWLAFSFGTVVFVVKILVEWYRYAERMRIHEEEIVADRPTERRGIERPTRLDELASLPTGVSLDSGNEAPAPCDMAEPVQPIGGSLTGRSLTASPHS